MTNRPTDRQTDRQAKGKLHFQQVQNSNKCGPNLQNDGVQAVACRGVVSGGEIVPDLTAPGVTPDLTAPP